MEVYGLYFYLDKNCLKDEFYQIFMAENAMNMQKWIASIL